MTSFFEEACPMYMLYGMTYDQYWYGDPWMVVAFRETFLLKQRHQNEQMWIQGAYIANAVATAINNCFGKRKIDYLKSPLDIYPKTYAEEQEEIRQQRIDLIRKLSMVSAKYKATHKKGTDEHG